MNQSTNIQPPKTSPLKEGREGLLLNTIIITAIFSLVVSLIMLFNYLQLANNDPIESTALKALVERLSDDPNNTQLQSEIRAFDLMARKAYFTSQWQIKTGGWLLLFGAIVLVVSLRYYFTIIAKIDAPDPNAVSQQTSRILSSKWLLGTGGLLIAMALIASLLSIDQLKNYEMAPAIVDQSNNEIEVIDLTENKAINELNTANELNTVTEEESNETEAVSEIQPDNTTVTSIKYPSLTDLKKQYNSFRGPLGQGVSTAKNCPVSWDVKAGTNVLWKVKIPLKGFSSPVIWGNKLFVTGANNQERWVYCYNANNGELLWQQQANNITGSPATPPKTTDDTGLAAPSVTTDGNFVIAIFGTGDLIAFNMDGNRLWAKNLGVPDNHYGHSSSLLSWKEKVIIQYDTNKGGRLIALNIQTGEPIWDTPRTSHISWASPILAEVNGKIQVITSTEPTVSGYDIETGKELWKVDCMMGEVGPSPAFGNGLVIVTNEYATLAAIDPLKGTVVWEQNEYLPEVASPVVADGLLIIATTYGVLACYDVHTGNKYWEAEFDEGFYSSPVVADGKIYAADMKGVVHIMKLDRESGKIADLPLGEKITTTPAFTDGRMYIRGSEHLYCIGK